MKEFLLLHPLLKTTGEKVSADTDQQFKQNAEERSKFLGLAAFSYYPGFQPMVELKQLDIIISHKNFKSVNSHTFLNLSHQQSLAEFKFLPIFHSALPE